MQNGIALFHRFSLLTLQLRFRSHFPLNGRADAWNGSRQQQPICINSYGNGKPARHDSLLCDATVQIIFPFSFSREHAAHTKVKPIPHRIWYQVVSFFIVPPDFAPQCRGEIFGLEIDVEGELQNFAAQEQPRNFLLTLFCLISALPSKSLT